MARTGKIARLPREIRTELNNSLDHNIPGSRILAWLNNLPEVKDVLQQHFEGKPVSEQNLSEWRQGGFAEWQSRRDFLEEMEDMAEDDFELENIGGLIADHAARLLSSRFALTLLKWNGDPEDPAFVKLKQLSSLVRDIATLRRGELSSARLKMERHAFTLACDDREEHDCHLARFGRYASRTVPYAPFQKHLRKVGLESRPPLPNHVAQPDVPDDSDPHPASGNPASPPPSTEPPVPEAPPPNSNQIKPFQTTKNSPRSAKSRSPRPAPALTPTPSDPPHTPRATTQNPAFSPAIVTKQNSTISSHSSLSSTPTLPLRPTLTDFELWQMRFREAVGVPLGG